VVEPVTTAGEPVATWAASAPVAELRAAIAFLTRLPVAPAAAAAAGRTGAAAFGTVGAGIAAIGAVPLLLLGPRLPLPAAVLALAIIAVVTGGLHLDGLADTADALAAPTPETAERARSDPRAGAGGIIAVVLDLLLGASLLASIAAADPRVAAAALIVAGTGSRAAAPIAARAIRIGHTRGEAGLGGWFTTGVRTRDVVAAIVTTIGVTLLATMAIDSSAVWLGAGVGLIVAAVSSAVIVARRGQLDGDGYGAIVEITFICILGGIAVLVPIS
jgi:adenosylcobinamide-GDP ribazoletransferase